jgi:pantothenate kinase
MRIILHY